VRLAFHALVLVVLGGTYLATASEGLQILALFALIIGLPWDYGVPVPDRNPPLDVMAGALAFGLIWAGLLLLVPDPGLGVGFWFWVAMAPWLEVWRQLIARSLQRDRGASWTPVRPWRDSALAGLAIVPLMVFFLLLDGMSAGEAVAWGAGCGAMVFVMCRAGMLLWTRGPRLARDA
jgi:hypothetical protein